MEEENIEYCITQLVEQDMTLKRIVNDLQNGCDYSNKSDLEVLESEARECVRAMRTRLEELTQAVSEEESELRQAEYRQAIHNYQSQLTGSQSVYRKAVIEAHRRIEKEEKDRLLDVGGPSDDVSSRHRKKENAEKMSTNVTDNLLSLSRLLHSQLEKSGDSMDHLVRSSATVKETQEEFKVMGGHISTTTRLLNKFGRRETTDRILMFLAFLFFFVTCAYIFIKRVF